MGKPKVKYGAPDTSGLVDAILPPTKAHTQNFDDNIQKIFKLGLRGYEPAPVHTRSDSTRKPQHYDKHLDNDLRPTKYVYCPGLDQGFGEIADTYYDRYKERHGMLPRCAETDFRRIQGALQRNAHVVRMEQGIVDGYAEVPQYILPIASALAFKTQFWEGPYLIWTREQKQDKAIADAALRVDFGVQLPRNPPRPSVPQTMENKRKRDSHNSAIAPENHMYDDPLMKDLQNVARYFPGIVLYEFKSLTSGTFEHMLALLEMTCNDGVDWAGCDDACKHGRIDTPITGNPTGFDAQNSIIQLTVADWRETAIGHSLRTSEPIFVLTDDHAVSAKWMTQQIWTEMVKCDATFLVLNSGNFEMIFVRNRAEKTLYFSHPIETTAPGYFQIHVGLYIASIRDALDRAAQLSACAKSQSFPLLWVRYTHCQLVKTARKRKIKIKIEDALFECQKLTLTPMKGSGTPLYRLRNLYERSPRENGDSHL